MPARAQGGKGRDRLARCSLSGLQYCVAIRDKLLGNSRARTHCITRCAIFLHYRHLAGTTGHHRLRLGTTGLATFLSLEGVRSAGRVSQATYASRGGFGRARKSVPLLAGLSNRHRADVRRDWKSRSSRCFGSSFVRRSVATTIPCRRGAG